MEPRPLIIGYKSAFDLWRLRRADRVDQTADGQFTYRSCVSEYDLRDTEIFLRSPQSNSILRALRATGLPRPIDTVVDARTKRYSSTIANSHVWSYALPEGYTKQVAPGICVCSPELALLQMSSSLSFPQIALLAYELCGTYVLAPTNEAGGTEAVCKLEQVYGVEGLRKFAHRCRDAGVRGAARLEEALGAVLDGSNSPAESALALMLVAPRTKGGFGLRNLELNHKVELSDKGRRIMHCPSIRPDGIFPTINEAYELDTKTWHDSTYAHENDSDRRAALEASGIKTHSITSGQAYDLDKLTVIAEGFAKRLGLNQAAASKRMVNRRIDLHEAVFPLGQGQLAYGGHRYD